MTLARPQTIMPMPIWMSAKPWYCARIAPESATSALDIISPRVIIRPTSTPRARIIRGLSPVARIAVPRPVRRKTAEHPGEGGDEEPDRGQVDRVAEPDLPAEEADGLDRARHLRDGVHQVGADRPGVEERDVAPPHDVEVDRVEGGGDEDAGEQPVDPEPGVQDARRPPGEGAGEHRGGGGRPGRIAPHDQGRGDRRPERQRSVGRDVGEGEDPEADEHPERQERQDQPDRPRSDQQRHGYLASPSTARGTYQMDPRVNVLSPAPRIGRESPSRWRIVSIRPGSKRCETVAASSTAPPGSGR